MRKYKVVTSRYHVLSMVEIDDLDQEVTCNNASQNQRGMLPTTTTTFLFEGSATGLLPTSDGNWTRKYESVGPSIQIIANNEVIGSSTTSVPYYVVSVQPKKIENLEAWGYTSEQIELIMDTNTENQCLDVLTFNRDQKMNANTFAKLSSNNIVSDDEIIFI